MFLYSLTLQPPGGIHKAIAGSFSSGSSQEIAVSRGKILEIYRSNVQDGVLETVCSTEVFGMIRSLCTLRMPGSPIDMLVVGSDSGKIVFLKLNSSLRLEVVHMETYGKSGCRRVVPGQYIASDPKGRALMVAAVEKQKFVYILKSGHANNLTIASSLESHKPRTIVVDICGRDVGLAPPVCACLEVEYGDAEIASSAVVTGSYQKLLVFYEVDLGLNQALRKVVQSTDNTASALVPVPGGSEGPGGVLLLCEDVLRYVRQDATELITRVPRRSDMASARGLLLSTCCLRPQAACPSFLVQSELGDLYKVTVSALELTVQYLDTIFPSTSLCILNSKFLFAAAESGNHGLYEFTGTEDSLYTSTSCSPPVFFRPRVLTQLRQLCTIESLSAVTELRVQDLCGEGIPQIYALCGRSTRASLRVLRHGLGVTEMAMASLPGKPNGVWSLRSSSRSPFDRYILISFNNASLVLSVGEVVNEVTDSGFDTGSATIHAGVLANNCYMQICQYGIRVITAENKVETWEPPGKISTATSNQKQVAITLKGGILMYFELDISGKLKEVEKREMEQEVLCIHLSTVPEGRARCRFLAVGLYDNTVKILALDPEGCLVRVSTQALPGFQAESVCLLEMGNGPLDMQLCLQVGIGNGLVLRTIIDLVTGQLSDTRSRYIGSKGVKLFRGYVLGQQALLALSSRTWIAYNYMGKYHFTPLSYEALDFATAFSSEQCPEGFVGIAGSTLRIFMIEKLGEVFNSVVVPLRYTPRKMEINPVTSQLVILESEHNSFPFEQRQKIRSSLESLESDELDECKIGTPRAGEGIWASCIRVFDPIKLETLSLLELSNNEHAVSLCICTFTGHENEQFTVVGTVKDLNLHPRTHSGGFLSVFRTAEGRLELLHKTPVEDMPLALCPYYGKILVGVGRFLWMYELGKRKLLKISENKTAFPTQVSNIKVDGERIFVSDLSESISVLTYRKEDNQIYCFADDVVSRCLCNFAVLDHNTVAAVDKFENVFVLRLPAACEEEEKRRGLVQYEWEAGFLNAAYYKMEHIAHFYIGDLATSLQKCCLSEGGPEILIYGTTMGAIGALVPVTNKDEVEFFTHLEMYMRQEAKPLLGRDHMTFRSFSLPVKNTIDGDLCEQFSQLPSSSQRSIAEALDHHPNEILKRLEEIKNKIF